MRPACYSPTLTEPGNEFYATQSGVLARADQAELEYIGLELFEGLSTSPSGERLSTGRTRGRWPLTMDSNHITDLALREHTGVSPDGFGEFGNIATNGLRGVIG